MVRASAIYCPVERPRTSIFFLHNPKAGGTALRHVLQDLSRARTTAPAFDNAPGDHRTNGSQIEQHRGHDLYLGHYGYDAYLNLRDRHLLSTNFRDPVGRVYSIYRYWRNNISRESLAGLAGPDARVVELAHDLTFSEFIRSGNDDLMLYISNFHFRQLWRSGWEPAEVDLHTRSIVKRRIRQMFWFYISEQQVASTLLLQTLFPEAGHIVIPRENESHGVAESVLPQDAAYLTELNELDYEIYHYALKLQAKRLAKITSPGNVACR